MSERCYISSFVFLNYFIFSKILFLELCANEEKYFYCDFYWELNICPVSELNIKQITPNGIIPYSEQ